MPDGFNVWDAPTTGTPLVDVAAIASGGEPAGRRNIGINVKFNTKKVLIYKYSSTFMFEVLRGPAEEKVMLCSLTAMDQDTPTTTESQEALYTAIKKKPNNNRADNEVKITPPSPHSVEELYTAVKKNVKGSTMEKEEGAPQIQPHTVKELDIAVMKKPKKDPITDNDIEAVPPIPPHTIEELYMAVQKGSCTAKNEEEAPPIPPHRVEDCC